jgi:hypothetical protein
MGRSPYVLTPTDEAILRLLQAYHYLTAEQITRLRYSRGSLTYVRDRLKTLTDTGYLQRTYLPRMGRGGDTPAIYRLARRGITFLRDAGADLSIRFRPSEGQHSYLFLAHTLAVNDVLIAADLLTRTREDVALASVLHERDLKRQPVKVTTAKDEQLSVIPDAWLDFRLLAAQKRMCIVLELDRGTVEEGQFRRKIRGLLAYSNGPYQEVTGAKSLTIAFPTTAGDRRETEMRHWTEKELTDLNRDRDRDLFRFRAIALPPDPVDLYLGNSWRRPFDRDRSPLLTP